MQVLSCGSLGGNILVHQPYLLGSQVGCVSNRSRADTVIFSIETKVHPIVGKRKIKLILALGEGVGVGSRRSAPYFFGNAEIFREHIHLGFIEVCNRFDISGAIAEFDEKPLVVFQSIWRAHDGVMQSVSMVVFEHFTAALFKIGSRDNREIGVEWQTFFDNGTVWILGYYHKISQQCPVKDLHEGYQEVRSPVPVMFGRRTRPFVIH